MRNKLKWGLVTIVMVICSSMGYFLPVSFSQQGMSGCFDANNPPDAQCHGNCFSSVKQKCSKQNNAGQTMIDHACALNLCKKCYEKCRCGFRGTIIVEKKIVLPKEQIDMTCSESYQKRARERFKVLKDHELRHVEEYMNKVEPMRKAANDKLKQNSRNPCTQQASDAIQLRDKIIQKNKDVQAAYDSLTKSGTKQANDPKKPAGIPSDVSVSFEDQGIATCKKPKQFRGDTFIHIKFKYDDGYSKDKNCGCY